MFDPFTELFWFSLIFVGSVVATKFKCVFSVKPYVKCIRSTIARGVDLVIHLKVMLNFVVSTSQSHQNWSIQPFHQATKQKKTCAKVTSFLPCLTAPSTELAEQKSQPHFHRVTSTFPSEKNASKPPLFFSRHKNPSALPWFGAVGKPFGPWMETMANGVTSLPVGETQFLFGGKNLRKKVSNCLGIYMIYHTVYIYIYLLWFMSWTCYNISSVGLIVEAWLFKLDWICWTHYLSVFLGSGVYPNILMRFDHF